MYMVCLLLYVEELMLSQYKNNLGESFLRFVE